VLCNTDKLLPRLSLLATLLLLGSPLASAADNTEEETRWYDVEVILFNQTSQQFRDSELWPMDYTLPQLDEARWLRPAAAQQSAAAPLPFTLLPERVLQLNAEAARIAAAPELELLLHLGWRQPGLPQEQAVSIRVHDGMLEDGSLTGNSGSAAAANMEPAEAQRMEGTLKLVLSRYLHIYADLLYREPMPQGAASDMMAHQPDAPLQTTGEMAESQREADLFDLAESPFANAMTPRYRVYRMQQSRRMRSTEIHYLDHPVLGMIIRVTPYELPESQAEASDSPA
jgi:hypothetical protein